MGQGSGHLTEAGRSAPLAPRPPACPPRACRWWPRTPPLRCQMPPSRIGCQTGDDRQHVMDALRGQPRVRGAEIEVEDGLLARPRPWPQPGRERRAPRARLRARLAARSSRRSESWSGSDCASARVHRSSSALTRSNAALDRSSRSARSTLTTLRSLQLVWARAGLGAGSAARAPIATPTPTAGRPRARAPQPASGAHAGRPSSKLLSDREPELLDRETATPAQRLERVGAAVEHQGEPLVVGNRDRPV